MRLQLANVFPALLLVPVTVKAATYNVVKDYSGSTFFDAWDFYDHYDDKMNGDVNFVSQAAGLSDKLAYVDPNTSRAIIKVDNTTQVPYNEKRNSVRITSKDSYGIGSVWVADMYHAPYGCSVWPAWWSYAGNATWPAGGEIDVFEGVNAMPSSQMGLHTTAGCKQTNPTQLSTLVNTTDCAGDNNSGCMLTNTNAASYGAKFADAQGGAFITEFAESGISIWFFPRSEIPKSVSASATSIDTSTLGTPMGNWPSSGCDISKFFEPQNLVFTVTLCGDFAGPPNTFTQTCTGVCYTDYVIKDPSVYNNAYFDISYVKVFSSSAPASSGTTTSGGSASNTQSGQVKPTNGAGVLGASLLGLPLILCVIMALSAL
ncbi:hypothetical protein D9611_000257 [Ephemerocybe angulata]|uniref:GH16 domain-containing protein n=1 Tax=Ephemerocybe angulata TaxID=980116 RepID=A0A8H5F7F2_9AGAR|nr:hypothetical protein D9611_000257 [Tulosesus angulatus]